MSVGFTRALDKTTSASLSMEQNTLRPLLERAASTPMGWHPFHVPVPLFAFALAKACPPPTLRGAAAYSAV
jgi:hypothetical protein